MPYRALSYQIFDGLYSGTSLSALTWSCLDQLQLYTSLATWHAPSREHECDYEMSWEWNVIIKVLWPLLLMMKCHPPSFLAYISVHLSPPLPQIALWWYWSLGGFYSHRQYRTTCIRSTPMESRFECTAKKNLYVHLCWTSFTQSKAKGIRLKQTVKVKEGTKNTKLLWMGFEHGF